MGTRIPSHQLSSGLYVSGLPDQQKERTPTMAARAVPYTGGDVKKSGELGKMFDIPVLDPAKSRLSATGSSTQNSGSLRSGSNSGPVVPPPKPNSGPMLKKSSGPLSGGGRQHSGNNPPALQPTGLITSGPVSSGPLSSSGAPRRPSSGQLEPSVSMGKVVYGASVTNLGDEERVGFKVSKVIAWVCVVVFLVGLVVGVFILVTVKKPVILFVVGGVLVPVLAVLGWNFGYGRKGVIRFLGKYPDAELRSAEDGQYVKVTGIAQFRGKIGRFGDLTAQTAIGIMNPGFFLNPRFQYQEGFLYNDNIRSGVTKVIERLAPDVTFAIEATREMVTCGSIPLESSYQRIPRCIYASTGLHEYRGWSKKSANSKHRRFSWGLRHLERHVADFYISDFQSGLRALVKAGYGAKVTTFVKPVTVVDITKENREVSPSFMRWLAERNLSGDDRTMRLEEGYIKEGSTVSVMGIVRRHDNVLMIVPPAEPVSMGCQWSRCLLPTTIEGLVLTCNESTTDAIPV